MPLPGGRGWSPARGDRARGTDRGRTFVGVRLPAGPTTAMRCPRCGKAFACGATSWGCWCGDMTLSDELRTALAAEYDGCLCSGCLRELATGR